MLHTLHFVIFFFPNRAQSPLKCNGNEDIQVRKKTMEKKNIRFKTFYWIVSGLWRDEKYCSLHTFYKKEKKCQRFLTNEEIMGKKIILFINFFTHCSKIF